jgi:hypothetical protein
VSTSWASADNPALPGGVAIRYGEARPIDAVHLAVSFGQGQGPTLVDVQTLSGTTWTTRASGVALTWNQNTATPEWLRIPLPAVVSAEAVKLVEDAVLLPVREEGVGGLPGRALVRQVAPGDAGAVDVEDRVQDVAQVVFGRTADVQGARAAFGSPGGQDRLDERPSGVGQVAPAHFWATGESRNGEGRLSAGLY